MENYLSAIYRVRFSDCDPFGHLNNARYLDYFLNAREDHMRDNYQLNLPEYYKKGKGWVIAQHELFYLRPAIVNENVCIASALMEGSSEHLLVELLMLDQEKRQLKALLHTRFVPINLMTGKREPHATEFMEFISDKILPDLPYPLPVAQQRVAYWQQYLKSAAIV